MTAAPEMIHLGDETIDLAIAKGFGPRVSHLARRGGPNVFAELPEAGIEHADGRLFRFRGGHRLWVAPEVPASTYAPDNDPVVVETAGGATTAVAANDNGGFLRTMRVAVAPGGTVVVDHIIENKSHSTLQAAAWAITQFPPDGVAVLPLTAEAADPAGVQANRSVVLWPYTDLGAPGVTWTAETATIGGSTDSAPFKIGIENRTGWIGYWRNQELFVKWSERHVAGSEYADRGASAQVYRGDRFLELETLSPLALLEPHERVEHREVWRLFDMPLSDPDRLAAKLDDLGLAQLPAELERT